MKFRYFLALVTIGAFLPAWAGSTLPYIGPQSEICSVVRPTAMGVLDAGYETDEACKIVFVKPPVLGEFNMNSPLFLQSHDCENRNYTLKVLEESYRKQIAGKSIEELDKIVTRYRQVVDNVRSHGSDVGHVQVNGVAQLKWNEIVRAYQKENPEKEVRALPISIGLLSLNSKTTEDLSDIFAPENTIITQRAYGMELPYFSAENTN